MKYLVACNWDPELINRIDYPEVHTLFGGMPDSIISSGRANSQIKKVTKHDVKNYVKLVHQKNWEFDLNLNASCTGNKELTIKGFKRITKHLEWICEIGVDAVTISSPHLISIVKKNFPQLKVNVSTYQKIAEVAQAQRFEDLGVNMIMLSEHINRDFKTIAAIRKSVKCQLTLIANVGCVYNCPNAHSHANNIAHTGARGEESVLANPFLLYCFGKRLERIDEVMKIRWIRPEDVSVYEDIGINMLKIIERNNRTDILAERVKAYCERSFDGNLLALLGQMVDMKRCITRTPQLMVKKFIKKPGLAALKSMKKARDFSFLFEKSIDDHLYLDNKKLPDEFIQSFTNKDCRTTDCKSCGACMHFASKAVTIVDENLLMKTRQKIADGLEQVRDGSLLH
ncbi:MAG TPA: U32 family peptidase [Chitinispirillaceae bacterium]|nr:U32 family peptidase [Chitinispirillaceae bacterium]